MHKLIGVFSIVGVIGVGIAPLPAQADDATVQTATQEAIVTGDYNQVTQEINQIYSDHPGRGNEMRNGGRRDTGTVQDAYQGAAVNGHDNRGRQESHQVNVEHGSRNRGRHNSHP